MPRLVYGLIVICLATILFVVVAYGLLLAFALRGSTAIPNLLPEPILSSARAIARATAGFATALDPTPHGGTGVEDGSPDAGRVQVAQEPQSSASREPQALARAVTAVEGDKVVVTVVQLPKPKPEEPELVGEKKFRSNMVGALSELRVYDPEGYDLVCRWVIKVVEDQAKCQEFGAQAVADTEYGVVYHKTPNYDPNYWGLRYDGSYGWTSDIPLYASTLVHEAMHIYLHHNGFKGSEVDEERVCIDRQIQTLSRLQLAPKLYEGMVKAIKEAFEIRYGVTF